MMGKVNDGSENEDPDDVLCGMGPCKPHWLQRLATGKMYLVSYGSILLFQGMAGSYNNSVLSTFEKRFGLSSKQSGFALTGVEYSNTIGGLIAAYFGNKGHRPRWVAWGMIIAALSCFVLLLPQFLLPEKTALLHISTNTSSDDVLCLPFDHVNASSAQSKDGCAQHEESTSSTSFTATALLFMGTFIHGLGGAPLESLAWTYMDDSVPKTHLPAYLGITMGIRTIGPTSGYVLGGITLNFYHDLNQTPDFDSHDPRWLGAWWLGFIVIGILLLLSSIPMMFFPRELPKQRARRLQREQQQQQQNPMIVTENSDDKLPSLKELPLMLKSLATNRLFIATTLEGVIYWFGFSGFTTFLPKYIEAQFGTSASIASYATGIATVSVMTVGFVGSGFAIQRFHPRARTLSAFSLGTGLAQVVLLLIGMTITCKEKVTMQGTPLDDGTLDLVQPCNADCMCNTEKLAPVCDVSTGTSFFSACHMGCAAYNDSSQFFESCACAATALNGSIEISAAKNEVTSGFCPVICNTFVGYVVLLVFLRLLSSSERIGGTLIFLRSVKPDERNLAYGVANIFLCLLGFLPCTVVFGAVIDTTCLIWEEGCDGRGNCWIYDNDRFRYMLHGLAAGLLLVSNVCQAYIWYTCKHLQLYDKADAATEDNSAKEEQRKTRGLAEEQELKAI